MQAESKWIMQLEKSLNTYRNVKKHARKFYT